MAVIVREKRPVGREEILMKIYKSKNNLVTLSEKKEAEKLDSFLEEKMKEITQKMKKNELIQLKGKKGVVQLWYEVGKCLSFVRDTNIVREEDRDFVWQAIYDHAGELHPGRSRMDRPKTNYFRYCELLAKFDWDFVRSTDWTSWVEFFDSKRIREDSRIINWLLSMSKERSTEWLEFTSGPKQDWVRLLTKAIRHRFSNRATKEIPDEELFSELEEIFYETYQKFQKNQP